jgi:hypothetical protein
MRILQYILAALLALAAPAAGAAGPRLELVMLERPGCAFCALWRAEIGPAYPKTWEGRAAPLRRVDLAEGWPDDLAGLARDQVTPTFILLSGGAEVGRIRGYPGDMFFWPMLDALLARAGVAPARE